MISNGEFYLVNMSKRKEWVCKKDRERERLRQRERKKENMQSKDIGGLCVLPWEWASTNSLGGAKENYWITIALSLDSVSCNAS